MVPRRAPGADAARADETRERAARNEPEACAEPGARAVPLRRAEADRLVRDKALALGFDVVGVARADEPLGAPHDRYRDFIARGMHGEMGYLAEHAEVRRRLDTAEILPGARSIVCVGRRYGRPAEHERSDPPTARGIARYARGQDYHVFVRKRLRTLASFVRALAPDVEARAFCDTEPILERAWAARAGLGFIGKHGLVITPGQGSYQILGEVITTLELTPDAPMAERCGSCTLCLDACPTSAFVAPFVLDPRRCIAYLTIEQKAAPPLELREAIGEHLFGCDDCQAACPYNRAAAPKPERTAPFHPHARWGELGLDDLARLDEDRFAELTVGTPLRRAGRAGLARNAVVVADNRLRRDPDDRVARAALAAGRAHDDPMVRSLVAPAESEGLPALDLGFAPDAIVEADADADVDADVDANLDADVDPGANDVTCGGP
jgi:epoxyqueuosine reductase